MTNLIFLSFLQRIFRAKFTRLALIFFSHSLGGLVPSGPLWLRLCVGVPQHLFPSPREPRNIIIIVFLLYLPFLMNKDFY